MDRIARLGLLILCLCFSLLAGCATQTRALLKQPGSALPTRFELNQTPFYAQERFQCGPAALAMMLVANGINVTPEELQPEVYIPAREGSLQPEMLAAARRHGALAVTTEPNLRALLSEIADGHPVLILQNLGLSWMPRWHYAVVIGYDLEKEEILLRSGLTRRLSMRMRTFEHTWARSQYWAMLTLKPGTLPALPNQSKLTSAAVAFERNARPSDAVLIYQSMLQQWPDNLTLQLGLGNANYAAGNLPAAEAAFRAASRRHTESGAALNNLATVLLEQKNFSEALATARQAVALGGPLLKQAIETLNSIESAIKADDVIAPNKNP